MSELERACDLHRQVPVVDAHCDTVEANPHRRGFVFDLGGMEGTHLDLPRLRAGGVSVQVFAAFVHPRYARRGAFRRAADLIGRIREQAARYESAFAIGERPGDLRRIMASGRVAGVISVEGGYAIENDIGKLAALYELGVRSMGLTWNANTGWADGCDEEQRVAATGGLSAFGREVVGELERLGMLVDVAHASPATFDAVLETARRPVVCTHTCARALNDHRRNLTDDQLRGIAGSGGTVGVCFSANFLAADGEADVGTLADHVEHMVDAAGEDHVGLGSDFDGVRKLASGLEDASRLPYLTAELIRQGRSEATVAKVLGGNWLRVLEGVAGL